MTFADGPMTGFDIESGGLDINEDRILRICAVHITPGRRAVDRKRWLIAPDVDVDPASTEIHGITTEYARTHGRPAAEVLAEVSDELALGWRRGAFLVGHNVGGFDLSLLDSELRRWLDQPLTLGGPVVDTLVLDRAADKWRKGSRKLADTAEHYRVRLDSAHDDVEDALAAARIAWRIARTYDWVGRLSLPTLQDRQRGWYSDQQRSFAKYLRDKVAPGIDDPDERKRVEARADAVDAQAGDWPMRGAS